MEPAESSAALVRESQALAVAATSAGLTAPVPSCPGWTVTDLVLHCATGDLWARTIIEQRTIRRVERPSLEDMPTGDAIIATFLDGARALADALAAIDPMTSVWTFSSTDRTVAFWQRRRVHETAMHRYDAQLAAGTTTPIDAALAADGIDEFLTVFLPRSEGVPAAAGESLHFHCTDVEGEWLLVGADGSVAMTREHAKGDVAVRGTASDLLLYLRGREPAAPLEVFGEEKLLVRFLEATAF